MEEFVNSLSDDEIFYLKNINSLQNVPNTTLDRQSKRAKEQFILKTVSNRHDQIF